MQSTEPLLYSIGTAVPQHKISQEHFYSILSANNSLDRSEKLMLRSIYKNCGISFRHSVLQEFSRNESADHLIFYPSTGKKGAGIEKRMELFNRYAIQLAKSAIENAMLKIPDFKKERITHLITFSCTGMTAPGIDIQIVEEFGLSNSIERTCINFMGCYAAINALKMAGHICKSNPDAVVLLCGVELCTLHYSPGVSSDELVANALFSDGAAAAIVANRSAVFQPYCALKLMEFFSSFHSSGKSDMTWNIGANGFNLKLSSYVPDLIQSEISTFIDALIRQSKVELKEISHYAIHPGGVKILEACQNALHTSKSQNNDSYAILDQYGNMSSVTVLFVLERLMKKLTNADRDQLIVSAAFGPGLTMESMLLSVA